MLLTSKRNWKLFEKSWGTDADVSGSSQRSPDDSSWELLETQDLRRLLLPQLTKDLAGSEGVFPGIVARRSGAKPGVVALGYGIEAQSVLALTTPVVLGQPPLEEVADTLTALLRAAIEIARRQGCQSLRCLMPPFDTPADDFTRALREALSQQEFARRAEIGEWGCEYSQPPDVELCQNGDGPGIRCERLAGDQLRDDRTHGEIQRVLERILLASSELPNLPRPVASDMMDQWLSHGTQLMLLRAGSQLVGLCAYDVTPKTPIVGSPDGQLSVWLQYIGVVREFRKQRCACRMIDAVIRDFLQSGRPIVMSVTADRANAAAVRLYESLGFQLKSAHEVWTRDVTGC